MNEWNKVKISNFLTPRLEKYSPDDPILKSLERLDKIDFSGNIFLSNKKSKTDMIIIYPGDFVISGINVAKGALAIYKGNKPIKATIHYSCYLLDLNIIDLEYLKYFVSSNIFKDLLLQKVKGGIKTEIKPKVLLPLEINLPSLTMQKKIVLKLSKKLQNLRLISDEIILQEKYLMKIKSTYLEECIEGFHTKLWRQNNPVQNGNYEYDSKALLDKILNEKKINFDFIDTNEHSPFIIPKSWQWVKLGIIIKQNPKNGYSPKAVNYITKYKTLKLGAVTKGFFDNTQIKYIDEEIEKDSILWLKNGDFLIERSNSLDFVGTCAIYDGNDNEYIYPDLLMKFRPLDFLEPNFIHLAINAPYNRKYYQENAKGSQKSMPKINQSTVINTLIPLPPLEEQKIIIEKIKLANKKQADITTNINNIKSKIELIKQQLISESFLSTNYTQE